MTVSQLRREMDSVEFSYWIAYTKYYEALPDSWRETSLMAAALLAPHMPDGSDKSPERFIPLGVPPRHPSQDAEAIRDLRRSWGLE